MMNNSDLPDADAENEELLQMLESSSQQVEELSKKLAETAMARVANRRRIDLRALKSLDWVPGEYQISISQPEEREPQVTLLWMPGTLILGPDLVPTDRDVKLLLPPIREAKIWRIPPPAPNTIPPPLSPAEPGPPSEAEAEARRQQHQARVQAWAAHHQLQMQAAEKWVSTDRQQANHDEERVAEAMMAEVEARRADPLKNARKTIMEVGEEIALQLLASSRNQA